ncbi:DEAD/DEAH box helicase [Phanerochaete sordida]|uniref:RNA helicase n=1 Tax=Phanerochaete sordida TaxID=48140 RepID=A0A9P3GM69_9APHY|nr:DEAD/DEAH box helicase [Phanerochaete sordida]
MSLLTTASLRAKAVLPLELMAYSFHTSSPTLATRKGKGPSNAGSSRTRLSKELSPRRGGRFGMRKSEKLEVAPPKPAFVRDPVPHPEAETDRIRQAEESRVAGAKRSEYRERQRERDERIKGRNFGGRRGEDRDWKSSRTPRDTPPPPSSAPRPFSRPRPPPTDYTRPRKPKAEGPVVDEFDRSASAEAGSSLPTDFASPPLMEGLLSAVVNSLGPEAQPTPIQALSLKHLFAPPNDGSQWRQYLLASETGSGKSLAYMLPVLQDLKATELSGTVPAANSDKGKAPLIHPRAIILAPTHELSRQLSKTAKGLLHSVKLRVLCASQTNNGLHSASAAKMSAQLATEPGQDERSIESKSKEIDVLVGTPSKVLEMVKGHGWDYDLAKPNPEDFDEDGRRLRGRKFVIGEKEASLERVEWVVVDEADVLFDPDFEESTRTLLADIAAARGQPVPVEEKPADDTPATPVVYNYPFHLLLTSATIPNSLASYLNDHHPDLIRLASPHLHKLPPKLKTEHASWTGGNKGADIEARIRQIWYKDSTSGNGKRSKVLVFCNKSTRVEEFGQFLAEKGIPNIALTSTADARARGSNRHLASFLRPIGAKAAVDEELARAPESADEPHVLITTSLLSRGLDFSHEIKHVLITDPPRNMIDFLHRAGRTGRAGRWGTVVVFGKNRGRGAEKDREVMDKVRELKYRS